jgi:hypothetical protein
MFFKHAQSNDICGRCERIRAAPRHNGYWPSCGGIHCICAGKRDHFLCHDFIEFTEHNNSDSKTTETTLQRQQTRRGTARVSRVGKP